jgi:hypothetical protein
MGGEHQLPLLEEQGALGQGALLPQRGPDGPAELLLLKVHEHLPEGPRAAPEAPFQTTAWKLQTINPGNSTSILMILEHI